MSNTTHFYEVEGVKIDSPLKVSLHLLPTGETREFLHSEIIKKKHFCVSPDCRKKYKNDGFRFVSFFFLLLSIMHRVNPLQFFTLAEIRY